MIIIKPNLEQEEQINVLLKEHIIMSTYNTDNIWLLFSSVFSRKDNILEIKSVGQKTQDGLKTQTGVL